MYRLIAPEWGQVLVFVLSELADDGKTTVVSVDRGVEEGFELMSEPALDLTLE